MNNCYLCADERTAPVFCGYCADVSAAPVLVYPPCDDCARGRGGHSAGDVYEGIQAFMAASRPGGPQTVADAYRERRPAVSSMEELPDHTWAFVQESPGTDVPKAASGLISAALLKMSPLQRQVFSLRYYEELDYDEISRITGSNKNTLMVSYYEARKKIEKEIENG